MVVLLFLRNRGRCRVIRPQTRNEWGLVQDLFVCLSVSVCVTNPGNQVTNCPMSSSRMAVNSEKHSHEIVEYRPEKRTSGNRRGIGGE